MTIDYTEILSALVGLCCALITGFLVPWLKSKIDAEKLEKARRYVDVGVGAAEQLFGAKTGEQKKQFVLDLLAQLGVGASLPLEAFIESAVNALFGKEGE